MKVICVKALLMRHYHFIAKLVYQALVCTLKNPRNSKKQLIYEENIDNWLYDWIFNMSSI
jgi:hypothetical protein